MSPKLSAKLVRSGWLRRVFEVEIDGGVYEVEYRGVGIGEWVLVNGVRAGRGRIWHTHMVDPHVDFSLGAAPVQAEIDVRAWPWLTMRAFRLVVGGKVLYSEGKIKDLIRDDLLARRSEVKLLEARLSKAQARVSECSAKVQLVDQARGSGRTHIHEELETVQEDARRLEIELQLARKALRVGQRQ